MKKHKSIVVCVVLFIFHFSLFYQTLHVVTKTVERSFRYNGSENIQLLGERSDIEISTWARDEIKIVVELSAKHTDRSMAEKDLEVFRYVAEKVGKMISIRNFVVLPTAHQKPQSNLKARYTLLLPANCKIELQNTFGKILLKGLQKDTYLRTEFCDIELTNLKGKLTLFANFGALKVSNFDGKMSLILERTDAAVFAPKGDCRIRAQYGSLDVQADKTSVKLDITTKNTELKNGTVAKK